MARTQAARLLGELAAAPDMHPLLVKSGAASALAQSGSLLVSPLTATRAHSRVIMQRSTDALHHVGHIQEKS